MQKITILSLMFLFCSDNNCMERAEKDKKKSAKKSVRQAAQWIADKLSQKKKPNFIGVVQDKESLKFDIMFMNGLEGFGHQEICAFAINKKYYALLQDLTLERKKRLISFAPGLEGSSSWECPFDNSSLYESSESPEEIEPVCWSKDGSACAQIITNNLEKKLKLHYWFIANGKANYCGVSHLKPLLKPSDLPASYPKTGSCTMRFHANGSLYIYGWREEPVEMLEMLLGKSTQLMEYSLHQNGDSFERTCGLDIGKCDIRSLFWFKSSPILLEAFLNSSLRFETDTLAIYTLEDAQIPLGYIADEASFEDELTRLPKDIRDAVRKRYLAQHNLLKK